MQQPVSNAPATVHEVAAALIAQAVQSDRQTLDSAALQTLLGALGCTTASQAEPSHADVQLRVSLKHSREFGHVISAGLGGLDGELDASHFCKGRAAAQALTTMSSGEDFLQRFKQTVAWQKLLLSEQRQQRPAPDEPLILFFDRLLDLSGDDHPGSPFMLQTLQLTLHLNQGKLFVSQAECTLAKPPATRLPRPIAKIDKLLHPASIGVIGVSATSMNFGRIILRNLVGSGYPKTQLTVIRPDDAEVDGIPCVANLKALAHKLDLLIVAVGADAVPGLVDEIIESGVVESVMLIPGSLGETKKSVEPAALLAAKINAGHGHADGGPIFLGANCLGVVSHPGHYDSWFIPLERLPKPQKKPQRNSVMLSQSGAFMITRLSQNPWLDPRYMLALGNQTDLTHGDLLNYFADRSEIETIGIYIEGFKDLDGLHFACAVRAAVLAGKQVVVYKAGKTAPGSAGVMGHTASIAGDPALFEAVMQQAGAIVAEDINSFDDLFYMAGALHHKRIGGNRLGAISGAGFEAVSMADAIHTDSFSMQMGALQAETITRVEEILLAKKLAALVEVRNPIDINPGADDEAHLQITEAFLLDPNIDAVVVGLDPTAPSVRALETSKLRPGYDINDAKSTVQLMPPMSQRNDKPIIGVIDGGRLYDAMAQRLMDQGVCVFRNCARASRALVRYCEARLYADSLRQRQAKS
ncbi:MAG: CoA-binding protein [Burkholderiales bacterium]|nr:CoA-binding protein [Burkholderiales bacterium]